jgi:hypothetical protein
LLQPQKKTFLDSLASGFTGVKSVNYRPWIISPNPPLFE